MQHPYI